MSTENKNLVRRSIEELWNNHNLNLVNEIVAQDHRHHDPNTPEVGNGPEGFKKLNSLYSNAFPDMHFTIDALIAEGDNVVARWSLTATHKGELRGLQPTGKRINISGISICRVENGKIVEEWVNWDALGLMQQLGVVPKTDTLKQAA